MLHRSVINLFITSLFLLQLLREGKPEDRIQTRTGALVSVGPQVFVVFLQDYVHYQPVFGFFKVLFQQIFPVVVTDGAVPQTLQTGDPQNALGGVPAH